MNNPRLLEELNFYSSKKHIVKYYLLWVYNNSGECNSNYDLN